MGRCNRFVMPITCSVPGFSAIRRRRSPSEATIVTTASAPPTPPEEFDWLRRSPLDVPAVAGWRFPSLAAAFAVVGSLLSNVVLAASTTAAEFGIGTLDILRAVTTMTWPIFFDEVWNIGDSVYALLSAGLAAFLSPRKLSRNEYYALRLWSSESDRH